MLERLSLSGFAVARSVVLEPGAALNVFTGETGAGKSLVVDALAFVFGGRRGREIIATGSERALVEATLTLDGRRVQIERGIGLSGRSSCRIDGEPATLDQLQSLAERLVDLHGQSEQLSILRPSVQLAVLDQFAGLTPQRERVTSIVRELRDVRRTSRALATDARERERLVEQLRFEVDEITAAALTPGEDDSLRQEHSRVANAGRILEDVSAALSALDASSIGEAVRAVNDLVSRDPSGGELADLAALLENTAGDLARALRHHRDSVDEDPDRLSVINERLDRIARLRRKYGETVEDILAFADEASARLTSLSSAEQSLDDLRQREADLLAALAGEAQALSRARRASAGDLVRAIAAALEHLGMAGARLAVGFGCDDDADGPLVALPDYETVITESAAAEAESFTRAFSETGVDSVEFLASFNPGEAPRPLAAVSSGGETSRFLLALTTVLGSAAEPRLVVLDEVDEGVGGRAGALVGAALARLAERHQVLCITHLPQVAAFGDRHFAVTKQSDGASTWSDITEIDGEARVQELALMLGGLTDANLAAARDLLHPQTLAR